MVSPVVQRFDVWLVQLDTAANSEIKKSQPCVVVSPDEMSPLKTAIVAPMTSKGFRFPTRIPCAFQGKKCLLLLDQIRAVDKTRLVKKLGALSKTAQMKVINCLQELFAY